MSYTHLTENERYQIYSLKKAGLNQKEIAEHINRSAATVSRELRRNKGLRGYRPKQAHRNKIGKQNRTPKFISLIYK